LKASKTAQDEVFRNPNISVVWNSEVRKINGDSFVKSVTIENLKTGKIEEIEADGLFVYIGTQPKTELFAGKVGMNEEGYILTNEDMATNIPGVFCRRRRPGQKSPADCHCCRRRRSSRNNGGKIY